MSRKSKAIRMRELVAKYHQSGNSLNEFATAHDMSRGKLGYWVRKFKESPLTETSPEEEASPNFIPLDLPVGSNPEPSYIIIDKPCGTQIRIPL